MNSCHSVKVSLHQHQRYREGNIWGQKSASTVGTVFSEKPDFKEYRQEWSLHFKNKTYRPSFET